MYGMHDEWRLIAGAKTSSESMLSCLRPGSATKHDRDLFAEMEMAGISKSSRKGHYEWLKFSHELSCE